MPRHNSDDAAAAERQHPPRRRAQPLVQRRGTRAQFLPAVARGRSTAAEREREIASIVRSPARLSLLADSAAVSVLRSGSPHVMTPGEFAAVDPMSLPEVRRPASWPGRRSRTLLFVVKAAPPCAPYAVWAESLNEAHHLMDLLYGRPSARLVTQAFRVTWRLERFTISHYPDVLWWDSGDNRVVVDVTSAPPASPATMLSWELTHRLCESFGWRYEVRPPMSRQRALNLRMLDHHAERDDVTVAEATRMLAATGHGRSLHRLMREHSEAVSGFDVAMHLLANGELHTDLELPITSATWLSRDPADAGAPVPQITQDQWRGALAMTGTRCDLETGAAR